MFVRKQVMTISLPVRTNHCVRIPRFYSKAVKILVLRPLDNIYSIVTKLDDFA